MPLNDPERLYRQLAENSKVSQSARLKALRFLTNPPYALLRRLASDPNTPGRLVALAADLFAKKVAAAQIAKEANAQTLDQSSTDASTWNQATFTRGSPRT
jgi:hypothetical protein